MRLTWYSNKTKLNPPLFPLYCFILMIIKMLQSNESYQFIFSMLSTVCFLHNKHAYEEATYIFLIFEKDKWEVWFWNFFHVVREAAAESSWTQILKIYLCILSPKPLPPNTKLGSFLSSFTAHWRPTCVKQQKF